MPPIFIGVHIPVNTYMWVNFFRASVWVTAIHVCVYAFACLFLLLLLLLLLLFWFTWIIRGSVRQADVPLFVACVRVSVLVNAAVCCRTQHEDVPDPTEEIAWFGTQTNTQTYTHTHACASTVCSEMTETVHVFILMWIHIYCWFFPLFLFWQSSVLSAISTWYFFRYTFEMDKVFHTQIQLLRAYCVLWYTSLIVVCCLLACFVFDCSIHFEIWIPNFNQ